MNKVVELPIEFGALRDESLAHPKMFGTFSHGQLVAARLAMVRENGSGCRGESAEGLEKRIIQDLELAAIDARL